MVQVPPGTARLHAGERLWGRRIAWEISWIEVSIVNYKLVGIDINIDGTRCHRVIYVLEQARFIVSCEGRNLPILITS